MQSQAVSAAAPEPESGSSSTHRLVIRVKLVPQTPPQPPVWRRLNRGALLLIFGAVAIASSWVGFSMFKADSASAPEGAEVARLQRSVPEQPGNEAARGIDDEPVPPRATETAEARSVEVAQADSGAPEQSGTPPSPVNEVIPEVPRSALDTIRGTVRVALRVTIDESGTVVAVHADDPGPSRYFQRLATEAAKQWSFTPATTEEQRTMLVKFNFTRAGATASAHAP